ncbi:MAG TPA: methyl-accepting chemotaxis protein [Ruminiclostridium sp.]|nr:methyl-accepting chemotaxis protein [Ruminiclostridium sp.]
MKMDGIGKQLKSFFSSVISAVQSIVNRILKKRETGKTNKSVVPASFGKSFALRKLKIKNRLIISFNVLLVVMLLITGIFSYTSSTNTINSKVKTYSMETIKQTGVVLNNQIKYMENYISDIGLGSTVQDALDGTNSGDAFEQLTQQRTIQDLLTNKFTLSNSGVINCSILCGDNFAQMPRFSSDSLEVDKEDVIKQSDRGIKWTDVKVNIGTKSAKYIGIVSNINSTVTNKNIAKMVLIPKANFLADSFKDMDTGKDAKGNVFPILVVDKQGKILSSRLESKYPVDTANEGSKLLAKEISQRVSDSNKSGHIDLKLDGSESLITYTKLDKKDWYLASVVPYSYLNKEADSLRLKTIIIGIICFLIAILLCIIIARSVSTPLEKLIAAMKKAKDGDLTGTIEDKENDEISEVCHNFNDMITNINRLVSSVRGSSQSVLKAAQRIATASDATYTSSEQVALTIEQIAKGSTDQAEEINDSVSHMDKLSEGIVYVEEDVAKVTSIANEIGSLSATANQTISELNTKSRQVSDTTAKVSANINDLSNSMKEIQKILKIMVSISEQTNLLSLNATIEAARAGEAGKGFAVVANEVRKLADQSKEFTGSINNIITTIEQKTNDTVQEVLVSNAVVSEQIGAVKATEELFGTVFTAMDEVLKNIERTEKSVENIMKSKEKVMESMENISAVAEESAATTEEISASTQEQMASAEDLANHAKTLNDLSADLSREISKFKTE